MATSTDRDYERIFVGNRQITPTHFFAVNWTEDTEAPIKFAFGYWTHDGIFRQGFVGYSSIDGFGKEVMNMDSASTDPATEYAEWFAVIAEHLRIDAGLNAETEWMGGGTVCVVVKLTNGVDLYFGTANETWGADVYRNNNFSGECLNLSLPSKTQDPSECAREICLAVHKFAETPCQRN